MSLSGTNYAVKAIIGIAYYLCRVLLKPIAPVNNYTYIYRWGQIFLGIIKYEWIYPLCRIHNTEYTTVFCRPSLHQKERAYIFSISIIKYECVYPLCLKENTEYTIVFCHPSLHQKERAFIFIVVEVKITYHFRLVPNRRVSGDVEFFSSTSKKDSSNIMTLTVNSSLPSFLVS